MCKKLLQLFLWWLCLDTLFEILMILNLKRFGSSSMLWYLRLLCIRSVCNFLFGDHVLIDSLSYNDVTLQKKAVVQHLYMGWNAPIFTEIKVLHLSNDDDHLVSFMYFWVLACCICIFFYAVCVCNLGINQAEIVKGNKCRFWS